MSGCVGAVRGVPLQADSRIIAGCVKVCITWQKRIGIAKKTQPKVDIPPCTMPLVGEQGNIIFFVIFFFLLMLYKTVQLFLIIKQMKGFQDKALSNICATTEYG